MKLENYSTHGRTLMVEFKCYRCGKTQTRPLEDCIKRSDDYIRELYDLKPPTEWYDGGFYYPLFCPECKKAYELFMANEKGGDER